MKLVGLDLKSGRLQFEFGRFSDLVGPRFQNYSYLRKPDSPNPAPEGNTSSWHSINFECIKDNFRWVEFGKFSNNGCICGADDVADVENIEREFVPSSKFLRSMWPPLLCH